jgi:hypothetical protein
MSISHYRNAEPLFLVIVRESNAQQLLQQWAKTANVQVSIDNNRMKIFDSRTFDLFHIGWPNSWNNVTIWDYWLKRHVQVPDSWKDS